MVVFMCPPWGKTYYQCLVWKKLGFWFYFGNEKFVMYKDGEIIVKDLEILIYIKFNYVAM